jgi:hypothetical protein
MFVIVNYLTIEKLAVCLVDAASVIDYSLPHDLHGHVNTYKKPLSFVDRSGIDQQRLGMIDLGK